MAGGIIIPKVEERMSIVSPGVATPQAAGPLQAAQGFDLAQAQDQVGQVTQNLGKVVADAQNQYDALKIRRFQQTLGAEEVKYGEKLGNISNPDEFATAYDNYKKDVDTLAQTELGERLTNQWLNYDGDGYFKRISVATDNAKYAAIKVQNRVNRAAILDDYATKASLAPSLKERARYDALAMKEIESGLKSIEGRPDYNPQEADEIKRNYYRSVSLAEVERDVNTNPDLAINKLRNAKEYAQLKPVERQRFLEAAQREVQARSGTSKDMRVNTALDTFANIAEGYPELAAEYLRDLQSRPGSRESAAQLAAIMGEDNANALNALIKSMPANDYKAFLNGAEEIGGRPDSRMGRMAIAELGVLETEFKKFQISQEKKTKGKLLYNDPDAKKPAEVTLRNLISAKEAVDGIMQQGTLVTDVNKAKAREMSEKYANWIGERIAETPKAEYTKLLGSTVDEYAIKNINKYAQTGGLSNEDRGYIYYDFYRRAQAQGIKLDGSDTETKKDVKHLLEQIQQNYTEVKAGVPGGVQYGAVIMNGRAIPYSPRPEELIGEKLEEINESNEFRAAAAEYIKTLPPLQEEYVSHALFPEDIKKINDIVKFNRTLAESKRPHPGKI
ncbi:hypothetical protein Dip510_000825 [Elusimicrobium posterum]|uniref:hypothetical protein n=1 Tax=Elusimicrobium posterum TaxID=3116653 RepID=UPI003C7098B9